MQLNHLILSTILLIAATVGCKSLHAQQKGPVLNHIAQYVTDLEVSTRFYRDLIGLDTIPEPFHDGRHTWFSLGSSGHLHIISGAKSRSSHDKNAHLCFSVPSVPDFIKRLDQASIPYESWVGDKQQITLRVDGIRQIYFQDPDGYWIEINDDYPGQ
jgi:lactoylglutathione lyase